MKRTGWTWIVVAAFGTLVAVGCGSKITEGGAFAYGDIGPGPGEDVVEDVAEDTAQGECETDDDCETAGAGPCFRGACEEGRCASVRRADGLPCDDGDVCTSGTACQGGSCAGGTRLDCDDDNPCTDDFCSTGGVCKNTPVAGDCEDGDPCTVNDRCDDGRCVGGGALECDDENPCTDDACDEGQGCLYTPNDEGCDDGDPCTEDDICAAGVCGGVAADCDDGDPCTIDSCHPIDGCRNAPDPECFCTTDAECDDDDPCTVDSCDVGEGCVHVDECECRLDGDCSDGVACTVDVCLDGACQRDASACPCRPGVDAPCDDANECTEDTCTDAYACAHEPVADGGACDDGDPCTAGDACLAGACAHTAYLCPEEVCDDGLDDDEDGATDCDDPDCAQVAGCGESDCANDIDDDADGATDCADPECAEVFGCFQQCAAIADAICGQTIDGSTAPAADTVTFYPDCGSAPLGGGEFVFGIELPVTREIAVRLEDLGAGVDLTVAVLEGNCDSASCVAGGDGAAEVVTTLAADTRYYLVVDGPAGGEGDFTVVFDCGDAEFLCADGYDNDFDDLDDCDDPDCAGDPQCDVEVDCDDGVDDDEDGVTDCVDPDCRDDPACDEPTVEDCGNGVDDDQNGMTDCFDFGGCGEDPLCTVACEAPTVTPCDAIIEGTTVGAADTVRWYPFCSTERFDGGERTYIVTPPENVVLSASLTAGAPDLGLTILGPEECNGYTCIQQHDDAVTHELTAGRAYYVVVDSAAGAEGPFTLVLQCGLTELFCGDGVDDDGDGATDCADDACADWPGCVETVCDDNTDNEGDGVADCADPDCWESAACTCVPTDTIACDAAVAATTVGGTDQMTDYPCGPFLVADAPERIFTFTADRTDTVTASLDSDDGYPLDLFVLAGDCGPQNCAAYGDSAVSFDVVEGETYHIVVDASEGTAAPFTLALDCGGVPEFVCDDGLDDDEDGRIDCADDDCALAAGCRTTCDAAGVPIACGQTLSLTNEGRPNALSGYDCETWPEAAGDVVLRFVAPIDDEITASLSSAGGADLDLFLLDGCAADACLDAADVTLTTSVYGGNLYYLVVDGFLDGDEEPFDVTLSCLLADIASETLCGDGLDDDADGATDCADADCDWSVGCSGDPCQADAFLDCGGSVSGSTAARRDAMASYACSGALYLGGDVAYRLVAPTDGDVTVAFDAAAPDLELFVLEDACGASRCVAAGLTSVTFAAEAGRSYYVVVDSLFGGGMYTVTATCP